MPTQLICVAGLPGCGKSVVARLLAERLDGLLLRTDAIRKELFAAPDYSPEESIRTYAAFYRRAGEGLTGGRSVVMDATFFSHDSREKAAAIARRASVPWRLLLVTAPEEIVRERIARRTNDISDADFRVYLEMKAIFDPMTETHIEIDNRGGLPELAAQVDEVARIVNQT
ncbi:AAA family ATPase [Candidatus Microgenomates bacterium]|nr:AAA family ATPase [Candidatus Microgenomates bacterium]